MAPTSVFPPRGSVFVPMLPESLKRVWIPTTPEEAINRACQLIEELGCGEVVGGMIDVCTKKPEPRTDSV